MPFDDGAISVDADIEVDSRAVGASRGVEAWSGDTGGGCGRTAGCSHPGAAGAQCGCRRGHARG